MIRTCLKCQHMNAEARGAPGEACPSCGAIYDKVEAARTATEPPEAQVTRPAMARSARRASEPYIDTLRARSNYPTFRELVRLIYWVWMVLAALALLGAVATLLSGSGIARVGGFLGGLFFGLFFWVVARVTRELSLMMADAADATVRTAELLQRRENGDA